MKKSYTQRYFAFKLLFSFSNIEFTG